MLSFRKVALHVWRGRERQRQRERESDRGRHRDRERQRQRQRDRETSSTLPLPDLTVPISLLPLSLSLSHTLSLSHFTPTCPHSPNSGLYYGVSLSHLLRCPTLLDREQHIRMIVGSQNADGGVGGNVGHDSHILYTYRLV